MKLHLTALLALSLASVSSLVSAQEASSYPLKVCVVSGEKLGGMGKPYVFTYEGREVQFCCKACLKDFNKDPKKYLAKLE
ncbi:MAG: YHS domain-containing protein [Verrucomicrobia bacterium]|nr:YHS domain-containing protein [Verrucomicrobiota bacterium]